MATNKSLKRDLNNIAETKEGISLNKKALDLNKDEINFNTEETDLNGKDNMLSNETVVASFNVVENGTMKNIAKSDVAAENKSVENAKSDVASKNKSVKNTKSKNIDQNIVDNKSEDKADFKVESDKEKSALLNVQNKEVINEEADDSMNLKIFKNYMDLCRKTGLIPSWTELNKFKQYYIG